MEIADLAGKIRDQRFDGWTDTSLADEIRKFSDGDGIGSIGTAVDALKAVATALAETDQALRTQLTQLGVEWQSQAGGAAGQVFTEQAGFSQDAMRKVSNTAELLFAQGEAFNRTKFKLPDPATLMKGAGGYTLGDSVLSLIGFETDHATAVDAAQNARSQALEALNAYAQQSGENLLSSEPLNQPQSLSMTQPDGRKSVLDLAGSAVDVTPDGGVRPASASVQSRHVNPPVVQPVVNRVAVDPPTPVYGIAVPPRAGGSAGSGGSGGSSGSAGYTAPASAPGRPVPPVSPPASGRPSTPPPGWEMPRGGGQPDVPGLPGFGGPVRGGGAGPGFEGQPGAGRGFASGPGPGSGSAAPGEASTGPDAVLGRGAAGGTGGGDPALSRGRMVGSGPQSPVVPEESVGGPAAPPRSGASAGELGAGAAALGAGVAGSAVAGDRERQGRGFGGASSKGPVRPLPVGELPEEEAIALRKTEQIEPKQLSGDAKFLAPAATQNEDDADHVRRFGVDDKDLFTDPRLVSDDVIGDDA
ncbi:hypothetical protein QRX50_09575 [Amycolatopsis carbonis]|uniref:PPE domain-containing protein n=1 Tax=Amycolatopsis carbonis TaxID=715471 RepID=A0A9Y2MZI3_9PSEU|nr:hypothetical protein [Amycolatopsis sp. 2-15]WIX80982.1 hypothetical protein QRX50_09575 [Amycolatopsis sp. 2-15]